MNNLCIFRISWTNPALLAAKDDRPPRMLVAVLAVQRASFPQCQLAIQIRRTNGLHRTRTSDHQQIQRMAVHQCLLIHMHMCAPMAYQSADRSSMLANRE